MKDFLKTVFGGIGHFFLHTDLLLLALLFTGGAAGVAVQYGIGIAFPSLDQTWITQMAACILGVLVVFVMAAIDYHTIAKLWKLYLPVCYLLVLLTFVIGVGREGVDDKAWLELPGGVTIQPAEFLKIGFIAAFAYHISHVRENLNNPIHLMLLCLHGAVPVLLCHFQGDDGTALVFLAVFIIMLFSAGLSWKYIVPAVVAGLAAIPLVWVYLMDDDKKLRVMSIITPGIDPLGIELQQLRGLTSIGSGQLTGIGLFSGAQSYVPEIYNDFIWAFIGQSLGYIGTLGVLVLFLLILWRTLRSALQAKDDLGTMICVGVFANLIVQIIINTLMCLKLCPVIGITLPFFSAGGSSVLSVFAEIGLVLSVKGHSDSMMFE